jgi:parallel beta-helix repeat protein
MILLHLSNNSVIHNGLGVGIMIDQANSVTVENNNIFNHVSGGITMKNSDNIVINNNVIGGSDARFWSNNSQLDEIAGMLIWKDNQNCTNLQLKNNIIGGFETTWFVFPTTNCDDSESISGNIAHSCRHGGWILHNELIGPNTWQLVTNFKAYKTIEQGLFTYQNFASLKIENIETLDCGRGLTINAGGDHASTSIQVTNVTLFGNTDLIQDDNDEWIDVYGIWLSSSTKEYKNYPEFSYNLSYESIRSEGNLYANPIYSNIQFKNWNALATTCETGNATQRVLYLNPTNPDYCPFHTFENPTFENVHTDALLYLSDPDSSWVSPNLCSSFAWTGPHNTAIKLNNAIGSGSPIPNISSIDTGATFKIIPNNVGVVEYIPLWTKYTQWNAYLCTNTQVALLKFESKDTDAYDRLLSPINILDTQTSFNNTLNSFMNHNWDGSSGTIKRLSRFSALIETNKEYEIFYASTPPNNQDFMLEASSSSTNWVHLKINYRNEGYYKVYADGTEIPFNQYNSVIKQQLPLTHSQWGENM